VKWNPPLLSIGIHERKHPLFVFREVDDPERDALNLGVKPVKVTQLEDALAKLGIMPDAGEEFMDRDHA